ncbi:hypothetical protein OG218_18640 [Kineococcus sp. NBC_00420]|uniref:hypothetical protein n=1 Tax=Kineococcus sp. NBC_00420 TaxID=2903564 RepID=UPI002E21B4AB
MTTRLTTPWWLPRDPDPAREATGSREPTAVLDHSAEAVRNLAARTRGGDERERLRSAHALVSVAVRPVYALDELQPASVTLRRGRGSCSQRMAVLEATARSLDVVTRCRGLLVDGRFWYPRFPRLHRFVPDVVVLAWPEFRVEGSWVPASHLFAPPGAGIAAFTNRDGETLFEALARGAVSLEDCTGGCARDGHDEAAGLADRVVADLGRFDSRDELFATHGQTLCPLVRRVVDPVTSRSSASQSSRFIPTCDATKPSRS